MSARAALRSAAEAGVRVRVDGKDLELEASSEPPACVLELLSRYKPHVISLLLSSDHGWSSEDWRAYFDERAGIAEFDGKLSRQKAEALAFGCCVLKWLELTFRCPEPGRCLCGGDAISASPISIEARRCRREWQEEGWLAALDFLKETGIEAVPDTRLQWFVFRRLEQDFLLASNDQTWPSIGDIPERPLRTSEANRGGRSRGRLNTPVVVSSSIATR
jgi:hypothetical protein